MTLRNPLERMRAQRDLAVLIATVMTVVAVCCIAATAIADHQRAARHSAARIHSIHTPPPAPAGDATAPRTP